MYTDTLSSLNIQISMSDKGKARQNGYAERLMLTIKEEEVYLNEYTSFEMALANIGGFIDAVYNKKRIHSALGYISPSQFEAVWRATTSYFIKSSLLALT
jgi:transposase InsO family protein